MTNKKPVFTDLRTRKKIDLHLRDINDQITEADIANVRTDITGGEEVDPAISMEADKILIKKKQDDIEDKTNDEDGNSSNSVETPWNILK